MQITPAGNINTVSATGLRELNATPALSYPQAVVATVLTSRAVPGATQSFEGQLLLEKQLINFLTTFPLREGQEVSVRATPEGNYRLIDVRAPTLATSVEQLVRQMLPQTQSGAFAQLVGSLKLILSQQPKLLPEKAQWAAAQLLKQVPIVNATDASEAIREWVEKQATPLEHHFANGAGEAKARQQPASLLQTLVVALEEAAPEISRQRSTGTGLPLGSMTERKEGPVKAPESQPLTYSPKELQSRPATPGGTPPPAASLQALLALLRPVFAQEESEKAAPPSQSSATPDKGSTQHPDSAAKDEMPFGKLHHGGQIPERTALFQRLREQSLAALANHQMERVLSAFENQTQQPLPQTLMPFPSDGQNVLLFMTLPVQHSQGESEVHLQIGERDAQQNAEGKKEWHWVLSLGFDIEGLGKLGVKAELCAGHLSGDVWAEYGSTTELVSEHLPLLRERLTGLGLTIDRMDAHRGMPEPGADTRLQLSLVDTRA